jgi:hypothetical protein
VAKEHPLLENLRHADKIVFADIPDHYNTPEDIRKKVVFVGPLVNTHYPAW